MVKISALALRQSFTKILKLLKKSGEPIMIEKGRKPAAVLISLEDYQRRFVDQDADARRKTLIDEIKSSSVRSEESRSAEDILRDLRNGRIGA